MKKLLAALIASIVSVSAFADIAVELKNQSSEGFVYQPGGVTFVDQALYQLIWTPATPAQQAGIGGAVGANEYLLDWLVTTSGQRGLFSTHGVISYADSDVGGNDINAGYFFVRVFDNAATGEGDYYLQQYVQGPSLTLYDQQVASTVYSTAVGDLGGTLDSQGYQVIPEPAVASLVCIFGVGTLFARRIFGKN